MSKRWAGLSRRERFDRCVEKTDGCWLWRGYFNHKGYGMFFWAGGVSQVGAHRAAWRLYRGDIPEGLWVLHRCDNPPCVNPDHLFLGTAADNMIDKARKGRGNHTVFHGESHPNSKLTYEQVLVIRASYPARTMASLAASFGVSEQTIGAIIGGRIWREGRPTRGKALRHIPPRAG